MNKALDCISFISSQLESWPMAAENFARISGSASEGRFQPLNVTEQGRWKLAKLFANHRRASITAKTDAGSIGVRPCFLCASNRPAEQRAIAWRDYEILVNPFPLSRHHLTVASVRHEPQAITAGRIADMAALACELDGMCVFYNGPRCGASAPDHFHFQAVGRDVSENIFSDSIVGSRVFSSKGAVLCRNQEETAPHPFFIIDSTDVENLQETLSEVVDALRVSVPGGTEPMMNIAMCRLPESNTLRTLIIPRGKHRPDCYYREVSPLLVSPATIEMLGTIVCSRKEDFDRIDCNTAQEILSESGLAESVFNDIVNLLKNNVHDS